MIAHSHLTQQNESGAASHKNSKLNLANKINPILMVMGNTKETHGTKNELSLSTITQHISPVVFY